MDSRYILGIAELDAQHEEIEAAFKVLQTAMEDKKDWRNALDRLSEKLRFHFRAEESIMHVFAYPETLEHKRSHLEILKAVESYKGRVLTEADIAQLKSHPVELFFEQILNQDLRFAAFLLRNKERLGLNP